MVFCGVSGAISGLKVTQNESEARGGHNEVLDDRISSLVEQMCRCLVTSFGFQMYMLSNHVWKEKEKNQPLFKWF